MPLEQITEPGGITSFLSSLFGKVFSFLPDSFIKQFITTHDFDFLGKLNWFIPFYDFVAITKLWAACCVAFYAYKIATTYGSKLISTKK